MILLRDLVLVKVLEPEQEGLIEVVGDQKQWGVIKGIVYDTGPGRVTKKGVLIPMQVNLSDIIYFQENHKNDYGLGKDFILIAEHNILGVEE